MMKLAKYHRVHELLIMYGATDVGALHIILGAKRGDRAMMGAIRSVYRERDYWRRKNIGRMQYAAHVKRIGRRE